MVYKTVSMWYNGSLETYQNSRVRVNRMGSVNFVSFRELRTSTGKIEGMLADDNKIIVTGNGKPKAIMIQINESNFEETLALLNRVKMEQAIDNIRLAAQQNGASEMTMEEIDEEIAQARKERRKRMTNGADND